MPGATDHTKTPMDVLTQTLSQLYTKKLEHELEDEVANKTKIEKIDAKIKEYNDIIKAKSSAETKHDPTNSQLQVATHQTASNPLATSEAKFNYNSMVNHFKSNVPTLEPPLDVSIFLQRLQNCYNLYVKPFKALEPYFIQQAKGHLSMDILETLNASNDKTETFEELQLYLKKNYGSRETPFQLLNSLMELDIKEGEKIQEFAGRLERKVAIVATQIAAKFNDRESNTDKTPMTATDCFQLFGSMLFYDHLRRKQPNCFNLMVKEVDDCWRPSDLGSMAATLVDRLDTSHRVATQTYSARPFQKQQQPTRLKHNNVKQQASDDGVCLRHLIYQNCPFGKKCKRQHVNPGDEEHNKIIQKLNSSCSNPSQQDEPHNANLALPQTSLEELQPEEVGMDFFDHSGLIMDTSFLYSHDDLKN